MVPLDQTDHGGSLLGWHCGDDWLPQELREPQETAQSAVLVHWVQLKQFILLTKLLVDPYTLGRLTMKWPLVVLFVAPVATTDMSDVSQLCPCFMMIAMSKHISHQSTDTLSWLQWYGWLWAGWGYSFREADNQKASSEAIVRFTWCCRHRAEESEISALWTGEDCKVNSLGVIRNSRVVVVVVGGEVGFIDQLLWGYLCPAA